MTISVTHTHISRGHKAKSCSCPLALAIESSIPGFNAAVAKYNVFLWKSKMKKTVALPSVAQEFVRNFDAGRQVVPFCFELDADDL
jgi:hypothetical protein